MKPRPKQGAGSRAGATLAAVKEALTYAMADTDNVLRQVHSLARVLAFRDRRPW